MLLRGILTSLLSCIILHTSSAQQTYDVKSSYNKFEHMVPVRDGVRLFTAVYVPKDTIRSYPILLTRTPYSCAPYGANEYPTTVGTQRARYFKDGYIIVYQDVRGRHMSEGEYENVRPYKPVKKSPKDIDETTDTYDTVEWLLNNVRPHNGRVGISGISYPGFYAWMGTIDAPPAVKATSPQAPVSKWMGGDDFFHNGAFLLPHAFNFYAWFGWPRPLPTSVPNQNFDHGTPDEYSFFLRLGALPNANRLYFHDSVAFWNTIMRNGVWNDFWAKRNIHPHLKDLRPATLVVGGWFDTENLFGALHTYAANERQSPQTVNTLVMGPWYHGQWNNENGDSLGAIHWGSSTSRFYTDSIEAPFFEHYLKDGPSPNLPEVFAFNTGVNIWKRLPAWPPKDVEPRKVFFREGSTLSFVAPPKMRNEYDEYVSDPSKPVPYTNEITHWYNPAFMLEDQRFASRRPDVLTYASEVLETDITIAGPIDVNFTVSTSGTDCDWVVKVIDVFPDKMGANEGTAFSYAPTGGVKLGGYQMLVRGDALRGKFRESLSNAKPFSPHTATSVHFTLQDAYHTFKKGHRIMIQIQSTWFPMIDRNPGKFIDIYSAKDSDFQKTVQRVYHSDGRPSYVTFQVEQ